MINSTLIGTIGYMSDNFYHTLVSISNDILETFDNNRSCKSYIINYASMNLVLSLQIFNPFNF